MKIHLLYKYNNPLVKNSFIVKIQKAEKEKGHIIPPLVNYIKEVYTSPSETIPTLQLTSNFFSAYADTHTHIKFFPY